MANPPIYEDTSKDTSGSIIKSIRTILHLKPGVNVTKLFYVVTDATDEYGRVYVLCELFLHRTIFVSKAGATQEVLHSKGRLLQSLNCNIILG